MMLGFQAAGAAPIFHGRVITNPETVASAIRIGNPASWEMASKAVQESKGAVDIVTDEEILSAQRWLATNEGIFVEPASAAPIAGLMKCCDEARAPAFSLSQIGEGKRIVCTLTGHGLKDPDAVTAGTAALTTVAANEQAVLRAIGF
jgi:threonine synthase